MPLSTSLLNVKGYVIGAVPKILIQGKSSSGNARAFCFKLVNLKNEKNK